MTLITSPPASSLLLMRMLRMIHVRATEEEVGMKLKHVMLLGHLGESDDVPQQALGDAIGLDANNLVLMLNDLEVEELIARRRDPADRRRHLVAITDVGRKRLAKAEAVLLARDEHVLAALSPEERDTLRGLMGKAVSR